MKKIEERLRDVGERFSHETDPSGDTWVSLSDALAIVADLPRMYRGEEIKGAPDGRYFTTYPNGQANVTPHGVDGLPKSFAQTWADTPDAWFFGPLPANKEDK